MRKHTLYKIDRDVETKCFQLKNIYPGYELRETLIKTIREFVSSRPHIYNGGWAIHKFLEMIDPKLRIYNENDICEMTDFDLFGVDVIDELIHLGYKLKKEVPEMSYTVNNGVHTNQFTIGVNFLGQKLVDWIHVPKSVFDKLPIIKYRDGSICVHPKIELLRHYYVLSDFFSVSPDKDINKLLKRINLLEKYVLIPWLKEEKLWYSKDLKQHQKNTITSKEDIQTFIDENWFDQQQHVVKIKAEYLPNELEFVVHDAKFTNVCGKLLGCVRRFCKEYKVGQQDVIVTTHEPFIGVIGPSYNGWCEINIAEFGIIRLYSLATPVHVADVKQRICSYFHSMAHWLWRLLYLEMNDVGTSSRQQLKLQVAMKFKEIDYNASYYTVTLKKDYFVGKTPIKNIYMMNNILRYKNINTVKIMIDDKKEVPKFKYNYNDFEGKVLMVKKLNKLDKMTNIALPSLHPSIPRTDK